VAANVIVRRGERKDREAIIALGMEALKRDPYPGLLISRAKVEAMAQELLTGAGHCCMVCERDGVVVGAFGALVHEMTFYERKQASVVQFYCKSPGDGIKLIREGLRWLRGRRAVKMICFTVEHRADPRIGKLLRRLGLHSDLPVYLELR